MKALSLTQPWANLITDYGMNVENRTWKTNFRGFFAIHATKTYREDDFIYCKKHFGINLNQNEVPYGAIIGFAKLTEVIDETGVTKRTKKWFIGDYGFVLENIIKLKTPVPSKGALNFWEVEESIFKDCLKQLTPAQRREISAPSLVHFYK